MLLHSSLLHPSLTTASHTASTDVFFSQLTLLLIKTRRRIRRRREACISSLDERFGAIHAKRVLRGIWLARRLRGE